MTTIPPHVGELRCARENTVAALTVNSVAGPIASSSQSPRRTVARRRRRTAWDAERVGRRAILAGTNWTAAVEALAGRTLADVRAAAVASAATAHDTVPSTPSVESGVAATPAVQTPTASTRASLAGSDEGGRA